MTICISVQCPITALIHRLRTIIPVARHSSFLSSNHLFQVSCGYFVLRRTMTLIPWACQRSRRLAEKDQKVTTFMMWKMRLFRRDPKCPRLSYSLIRETQSWGIQKVNEKLQLKGLVLCTSSFFCVKVSPILLLMVKTYACDWLKPNDLSFQNAVLEEKDNRQMTNFCVIHDVLVMAMDWDNSESRSSQRTHTQTPQSSPLWDP